MNSDNLEGKTKNGAGHLKRAAAAVAEDPAAEFGSELRELQGKAQEAIAAAGDKLAKSAVKARAVIGEAADQASDAYGDLRDRARKVAETVNPFVRDRPYASLAIAGIAGLVLGILCFARGPKVIYVKPVA
jgi:ElaB/YqjD/DUF883 family membrane-anchored ribosome-binding protein